MKSPRRKVIGFAAGAGIFLGLGGMILNCGCTAHRSAVAITTEPAIPDSSSGSFINSIGMEFAVVKSGEFVMGSPSTEAGHDADETEHRVRITKPFFLGVYPVTQGEYSAVMGKNPSYFHGDDLPPDAKIEDLPVDSVSWEDAVEFCRKLSAKEGRHYRLPTEAEWEYACRAGTTGPFAGDGKIDDIGWYLSNSGNTTHPVGMLQANDWGFFDMQGNVWEWVADWYGKYPPGDAVDPTGPSHGTTRVLRGGTMEYEAEYCRAAFRNYYVPDERIYYIGFRVALDIP